MDAMIELFGQHCWHSDGAIRLNRAGAELLIAGLQNFLKEEKSVIKTTASDGEGYDLHIISGELHDMLNANHYLDAPGLPTDSADNLLYKVQKTAIA